MMRLVFRSTAGRRARQVQMPGWALGLVTAASAALGIAVFVVVTSLAVVLLPLLLVVGGVTAFVMRRRIERLLRGGSPDRARGPVRATGARRRATPKRPRGEIIEDAEYRVITPDHRDRV